jgi:hypothetical protein
MKIFPLYKDFFQFVERISFSLSKWKIYYEYYYQPHQEFLDIYFSHFPLLDPSSLKERVEKIKVSDYSWLQSLLSVSPPEKIITQAYKKCIEIVPPEEEPNVYLFVGFFSPDGFVMNFKGKPVICFGLERFKDFSLLKIIFAHEYAHFLLNSSDGNIPERMRFKWLLISEGLGTYFSKLAFPNPPLADHLLFRRDRLNWCQANESHLREIFCSGKFSNQELLDFYFKGNPKLDLPPRAGKYLGFQAIKKYLADNKEKDIGSLLTDKESALSLPL